MALRTTRRVFLKQVAMAGAVAPLVLTAGARGAAGGKLRHASIGVGGMGEGDLGQIGGHPDVRIVALCDVDRGRLEQAAKKHPDATLYQDWRELLQKEGEGIDSVNVTTPDHMHAPIAMSAIRKGKHVFCEKPLTHEVFEARQLTLEARKAGVVTQMGIQIHSHMAYRGAVRMLRDGAIGKVREWHSWCSAKGSSPGLVRPEGEDPVPPHVAWDLWLGVAPPRPYKEAVYHPGSWRKWQDFGCGALGDFGCHIFDPIFTALGIGAPLTVHAEPQEVGREVWPVSQTVNYMFPGTSMTAGKTISATWRDGGLKPSRDLAPLSEEQALPDSGSLIIGEEGVMLLPHYDEALLLPADKYKDYQKPEPERVNHYTQWVEACLEGKQAPAHFDYAGPLTEAVLVGNVAARLAGQALEWNATALKFANSPEADALLRRPYRPDWHVEGLG